MFIYLSGIVMVMQPPVWSYHCPKPYQEEFQALGLVKPKFFLHLQCFWSENASLLSSLSISCLIKLHVATDFLTENDHFLKSPKFQVPQKKGTVNYSFTWRNRITILMLCQGVKSYSKQICISLTLKFNLVSPFKVKWYFLNFMTQFNYIPCDFINHIIFIFSFHWWWFYQDLGRLVLFNVDVR